MTTKITLYNNWEECFKGLPEILPDLIQRLTKMLETVPSELHDETYCELSTEYESSSVDIDIYYLREETAEEQKQREDETAEYEAKNEARIREQYEKLKARFDP